MSNDFSGSTYSPKEDKKRLCRQAQEVFDLMKDAKWRTLREINQVVAGSETAISARLRDFRKKEFGSHDVNRDRLGDRKRGIWIYQLIVKKPKPATQEELFR